MSEQNNVKYETFNEMNQNEPKISIFSDLKLPARFLISSVVSLLSQE